ncbi:glucose 1-dehydrogenase [Flavobacterium johnsoniae]|uniref:NAD(P)-dependent dehydrogenase, short-chain alcohol dehydrogenase family n=1 Tax=Flavobacterium johnsoniae TaxID=986 RepID=A0A1M5JF18_FLAJO|nr:glucose 1-dehydrogenase [Flavobacterium johnsoniae]SHG39128.1 NAD(P)-dependent dehydrogenase, short-chain alcohol dehydrogenase family [Flavobacterium johnsoniae]
MRNLENKVAVITGGSSGIGYESAAELTARGAKVIITGRSKAALAKAETELNVTGIVADQSDLKSIDSLVEKLKAKFGKIDILFLNAGIAFFEPVESASEEHFDKIIDVNVKGVYFTVQKLLPVLNDGGSIIFTTSANAHLAIPNSSVYSLSKAAVLSLNKVLSVELAPRKIRVNALTPGPVETPIFSKLGMEKEEIEGFSTVLSEKILLKRFGKTSEIAKTVAFLASSDASFITGSEIVADGGLTVNSVI